MREPARLMLGDCLERMGEIGSATVDAIIADPPYPEIDRSYGRMTEAEWHAMMRVVVAQSRRILKPSGSAVFILQPNSEKAGKMRPWLWEFMAWTTREWNMVQDAWWWNFTALPMGGAPRKGLMRSSVKACVWLGPFDCYRDQDSVLWTESQSTIASRAAGRAGHQSSPSNWRAGTTPSVQNTATLYGSSGRRGGVTPFNMLPIDNDGKDGLTDHGARTPLALCDWWTRYISPEGGVVCDPFMGSGTVGLAALKRGRRFIGIERDANYFVTAQARIRQEIDKIALLTEGVAIA